MNAVATPVARKMSSAHAPARRQMQDRLAPEAGSPQQLIDVDRIDPNPLQVRGREAFDENDAELLSLVESLKGVKQISPIHVEESSTGRYVLIAGERRLSAAKLAGWRTITAFVCRGLSQAQKIQITADENLQRRELNAIERARQLALLNKPIGEGGGGLSQQAIAKRYGFKNASSVTNIIKLNRLPTAWQERVLSGELCERKARALVAYEDRGDVLGAVEMDYKRNADRWKGATADAFDAELKAIAERLDSLKKGGDGPRMSGESSADSGPVFDSPALPLQRRSAPVNHELPPELEAAGEPDGDLSDDAVARILDSVFDVLDKLPVTELDRVVTYIGRRKRGEGTGPEVRLPSKRGGQV